MKPKTTFELNSAAFYEVLLLEAAKIQIKRLEQLFSSPEPYQKTCRISYDGKLLATGGDDGKLRVWTFPDLNSVHEIEAHKKEIDDLEFRFDLFSV